MNEHIINSLKAPVDFFSEKDALEFASKLAEFFSNYYNEQHDSWNDEFKTAKGELEESLKTCIRQIIKDKSGENSSTDFNIDDLWYEGKVDACLQQIVSNFTKEEDKEWFNKSFYGLWDKWQYEKIVENTQEVLVGSLLKQELQEKYKSFVAVQKREPRAVDLLEQIFKSKEVAVDIFLYKKIFLVNYFVTKNEHEVENIIRMFRTGMLQHLAGEYAKNMMEQDKIGSCDVHQDDYELFLTEAIGTDTNENFKLIKIERKPLLNISDKKIQEMMDYAEKKNITFIEFYNMLDEQAKQREQTFIEFYNMLNTEAKGRRLSCVEFYNALEKIDTTKSVGENFELLMEQTVKRLKQYCKEYKMHLREYQTFPKVPTIKSIEFEADDQNDGEVDDIKMEKISEDILQEKRQALLTVECILKGNKSNFEKIQDFRQKLDEKKDIFGKNRDSAGRRFLLSAVNFLTFGGFDHLAKKYDWKRFSIFSDRKYFKSLESKLVTINVDFVDRTVISVA